MTSSTPWQATQPILSVEAVRAVETRHLSNARPTLMERAGAAAADIALTLLAGRRDSVVILCGPGNNGGDGLVVARLLRAAGCKVRVVFRGDPAKLPADAAAAHLAYVAAGGTLEVELPNPTSDQPGLLIDALFGIGLTRPISGDYGRWVEWANASRCPRLALDIPSGLNADSGHVPGVALRATHTATFIALKPGMLTLDGPDHCGQISVHALDLRWEPAGIPFGLTLTPDCFVDVLRPRALVSHKGNMGDALIIGGAAGMVGAVLLAGRAAIRLGAGRVFVGVFAENAPVADALQPELMLRTASELADRPGALALGPGLGTSEAARAVVLKAVRREGPLVLDADALNIVAAHQVLGTYLSRRQRPAVLTPHPAEAGRLLACPTSEVQNDRVRSACRIAAKLGSIVVLKGHGSVVADPAGNWWINTSGNPGMASAGMGDVLTGMVAALLAQGWNERTALLCAVHLHGRAADRRVASGHGPVGLTAGELADEARSQLNEWISMAGNE